MPRKPERTEAKDPKQECNDKEGISQCLFTYIPVLVLKPLTEPRKRKVTPNTPVKIPRYLYSENRDKWSHS